MSWFTNWFDSPYYHILYKNRDEKEAQVFINNLIEKLQLKKSSKLIDIACGKGRHATYFNKKEMTVIGIDLSPKSIAYAKQNENNNLHFFVHDMREVYKENHFDIATNLFTSFGYFKNKDDEQKAINAMARNLKSDGILIIDFMNIKKVIPNLISSEKKTINDITFNIKRSVQNNHIIKDIEIIIGNETQHFQEKVRAITLADFSIFFRNVGLNIIDIFGNYKLDDFDATISDRLILICKK